MALDLLPHQKKGNTEGVRQVTSTKVKSGTVVKHQRIFVVYKLALKCHFKSSAIPFYCSSGNPLRNVSRFSYLPGIFNNAVENAILWEM